MVFRIQAVRFSKLGGRGDFFKKKSLSAKSLDLTFVIVDVD
jgi:hypothetical protein